MLTFSQIEYAMPLKIRNPDDLDALAPLLTAKVAEYRATVAGVRTLAPRDDILAWNSTTCRIENLQKVKSMHLLRPDRETAVWEDEDWVE